ncbi:hypothetical protein PGTUg99_021985 [Puccinia graminis f. sp. tritici]|uniref:Uncharacterized protein n=1 Tax=Puccinia graminis f. sp. tritici TaxID=56615 RepID=A0A5B0RRN3_PUCGR|nr:hypothetical protein PGTUg99_021985 [Puccinia graminis f. sp. tritici]
MATATTTAVLPSLRARQNHQDLPALISFVFDHDGLTPTSSGTNYIETAGDFVKNRSFGRNLFTVGNASNKNSDNSFPLNLDFIPMNFSNHAEEIFNDLHQQITRIQSSP